jgi:hypothetical protein
LAPVPTQEAACVPSPFCSNCEMTLPSPPFCCTSIMTADNNPDPAD